MNPNLRRQVRRTLIKASGPARRLGLPLARPAMRAHDHPHVVYRNDENATIDQPVAWFGKEHVDVRSADVTTVVISAGDSSVTFRNNHAFGPDRRLLYEENIDFEVLPVSLEVLEQPTLQLDNVAYLSNTWPDNFYHWLCLTLPLLRYYEEAELEIDKVYIGRQLKDWQRRSLELAGVDADRIVTEACHAELAHVAVSTRVGGAVLPSQIQWVRERLLPNGPRGGSRRLFVGRGQATTRRMVNENEAAEALAAEFGFEYVTTSGMTLDDEMELFGSAEAIVSPYGAALTNVFFAPAGTRVLEIRAHDADFPAASAFVELSRVLGHVHGVVNGDWMPAKGREISTDIKIETDVLLRHVAEMLEDQ